jgi:hypothetical protein
MNYTWTTRDGRKLDVDSINDVNHLRNIIKMMMRNERQLLDAVNKSNSKSFSLNGDMAQFSIDQIEDDRMDPQSPLL